MHEVVSVLDNARLQHFAQQVVSFAGSFTYAGKYRKSTVSFCNIVDEFLNQYGFTYTGTAKETNFTSFCVRLNKVDNFNSGEKYFCRCRKIFEFRSRTVNGNSVFTISWQVAQTVDSVSNNVKKASVNIGTYR